MNLTEKVIEFGEKTEKKEKGRKIVVTHITIRQSIFFLVLKLFVLEFFAAACLVTYYIFVISSGLIQRIPTEIAVFNLPIFLLAVLIKSIVMIYVIVLWLEEYYEITTNEVYHRKGFIIKREERFTLEHIGSLKMEQGIFGRIFNYGTLKLYDWANEQDIYLYLIHNPLKYYKILKELLPNADVEEKMLRRHVVDIEEDN